MLLVLPAQSSRSKSIPAAAPSRECSAGRPSHSSALHSDTHRIDREGRAAGDLLQSSLNLSVPRGARDEPL